MRAVKAVLRKGVRKSMTTTRQHRVPIEEGVEARLVRARLLLKELRHCLDRDSLDKAAHLVSRLSETIVLARGQVATTTTMTASSDPLEAQLTALCEVDGLPILTHARCRECTILVGPKHLEWRLDANQLCNDCSERVAAVRRQEQRQAPAIAR
jgi:hypothetical protein